MRDLTKLAFDSALNYLKRSETFGKTTGTYGGAGSSVLVDQVHAQGFVPFFIAGVELFNDGVIWSNQYVDEGTLSISALDLPPNFSYWCTNNILTVNLQNGTGVYTQAGTVDIYYGTYLDYA